MLGRVYWSGYSLSIVNNNPKSPDLSSSTSNVDFIFQWAGLWVANKASPMDVL